MTYHYQRKGIAKLKAIATSVLDRFPDRRIGRAIDIEGIIEDLGVDILPRQGFRRYAEGYLAADPRIIVVDERIFTYLPRARFTLAEEICHLILEYELWNNKELPLGGSCHELTEEQHYAVERDAKTLAAMILMPDQEFESVFRDKVRELHAVGVKGSKALSIARNHAAEEFQVSPMTAGYKALDLKLVQE
ncbi:MAG: ImmA/IrrE family metallo-endopeptidase [Candidatus Hydrogenedentes bacterium]|nr:ImmA/IrrE family metallo-endopeptidase [Candidatus Hydrogenedentota bacterium]